MIDPKFAYLPYIAQNQPDVYETEGSVDNNETEFYQEETHNESIEKIKLNTQDSYKKFKGKYLIGNVDFSDNLGKKRCIGYNAISGDWDIVGFGEKENPIQKCQRLQCEMNELMEELTTLQNDATVSKEEKESFEQVSSVVNTAKKVLESLRLEQVLGQEAVASSSDKQVKNLIAQVEEYKKSGGPGDIVKAKSHTELVYSTRIAELEHKLHKIEQTVGAKPDKVSRLNSSLGTNSLLEAVHQLSTRSALLQPNQLDLIEQRLSVLAAKMDTFVEKSTGGDKDSLRDQKIVELYDLAKTTEPITKILPDILDRMQTLESLHTYAANFSKLFAELEESQATITKSVSGNKELLQNVQKAFADNHENVSQEVTKLEQRMNQLGKK